MRPLVGLPPLPPTLSRDLTFDDSGSELGDEFDLADLNALAERDPQIQAFSSLLAEHNPPNRVVQRAEQSDVAAFLQSQLQQGLTPIANVSSIRPFNGVYTTVEEMLTAHAMQPGQRGRAHVVTAANRMLGEAFRST